MIKVKAGQRWLWDNTFTAAVVEVCENVSFKEGDYAVIKCRTLKVITGNYYGAMSSTRNWLFGKHWKYLKGQDKGL